jgi:hypothetical protein
MRLLRNLKQALSGTNLKTQGSKVLRRLIASVLLWGKHITNFESDMLESDRIAISRIQVRSYKNIVISSFTKRGTYTELENKVIESLCPVTFGDRRIYEIREACLLGSPPLLKCRDGWCTRFTRVFNNPERHVNELLSSDWKSLQALIPRLSNRAITTPVLCLDFLESDTYFHWVADGLLRLSAAQLAGYSDFKILLSCRPLRWQLESLELMGFKRKDIISNRFAPTRLTKLILVDFLRESQYYPVECWSHMACKMKMSLPSLSTDTAKQAAPRRIFVNRNRGNGRSVVNSNELTPLLTLFGFKTLSCEEMSIADQVEHFSNADVVLAPHGAALANLAFCNPRTLVVELFGDHINPIFCKLANSMGLRYRAIQGKAVNGRGTRKNFEISQDSLKAIFLAEGIPQLI